MFTSACASRPACRQVAVHRSLCCIASLPPSLLATQPNHCLRKSATVSTSGCASLSVSPCVSALTSARDSRRVSTSACPSRPACRQVAAHRSLCRLAPLPPPMLSTQPACPPLPAQVGLRVDQWLRISQCAP